MAARQQDLLRGVQRDCAVSLKGAHLKTFGSVMRCLFAWGLLVSVEKRAQRQLEAGSTRPDAGVSFVSPKTKLALPSIPAAPRKQALFYCFAPRCWHQPPHSTTVILHRGPQGRGGTVWMRPGLGAAEQTLSNRLLLLRCYQQPALARGRTLCPQQRLPVTGTARGLAWRWVGEAVLLTCRAVAVLFWGKEAQQPLFKQNKMVYGMCMALQHSQQPEGLPSCDRMRKDRGGEAPIRRGGWQLLCLR